MVVALIGEELSSLDDVIYSNYTKNDLEKLVQQNQTLPINVRQVEVRGANSVRSGLVAEQLKDVLNGNYVLPEILTKLDEAKAKLERLNVFDNTQSKIGLQLVSDESIVVPEGSTKGLDVKAVLDLKEGRIAPVVLKSYVEDDIAGVVAATSVRNLFRGAEALSVQAELASEPRPLKSFLAELSTPLKNSPDLKASLACYKQTKEFPFAGTTLSGLTAKIISISGQFPGSLFEAGVEYVDRKSTTESSVKSSIFSHFIIDRREFDTSQTYPSSGFVLDSQTEIATPLAFSQYVTPSTVAHFKSINSASYTKSLDAIQDRLVFNANIGAGFLWNHNEESKSSKFDRFFHGGPNGNLYGFGLNGLGSQAGGQPLGSEAYSHISLSFLGKVPRLSQLAYLSPLRYMLFFSAISTQDTSSQTSRELVNNLITGFSSNSSTCAGAGFVYKGKDIQAEVVYGMPLKIKEGEIGAPGVRIGVGMEVDF